MDIIVRMKLFIKLCNKQWILEKQYIFIMEQHQGTLLGWHSSLLMKPLNISLFLKVLSFEISLQLQRVQCRAIPLSKIECILPFHLWGWWSNK